MNSPILKSSSWFQQVVAPSSTQAPNMLQQNVNTVKLQTCEQGSPYWSAAAKQPLNLGIAALDRFQQNSDTVILPTSIQEYSKEQHGAEHNQFVVFLLKLLRSIEKGILLFYLKLISLVTQLRTVLEDGLNKKYSETHICITFCLHWLINKSVFNIPEVSPMYLYEMSVTNNLI